MLKPVFEGDINIFLSSDNKLTAGQLVKLDTANEGKILAAGAGDEVYGIVAQDVVDPTVDNLKLDSVTAKAYLGGKVGVYFNGGLYNTDQTADNVTFGAELYAGAGGKLSTTASGNAVAIAEGTANAGQQVRIRLLK